MVTMSHVQPVACILLIISANQKFVKKYFVLKQLYQIGPRVGSNLNFDETSFSCFVWVHYGPVSSHTSNLEKKKDQNATVSIIFCVKQHKDQRFNDAQTLINFNTLTNKFTIMYTILFLTICLN